MKTLFPGLVRPQWHPIQLRLRSAALLAGVGLVLGGCGSTASTTRDLLQSITPYQVPVVQGNFISREQVQALSAGMSRQQVQDLLGTPLLTSLFHGNRWDYAFTLQRPGSPPVQRRLSLVFEGKQLASFEGDPMPSETEFVSSLAEGRKIGPVPDLSAPPVAQAPKPVGSAPATPSTAATPRSYPPLETELR